MFGISVSKSIAAVISGFLGIVALIAARPAPAAPGDYFVINVVDAQTGRGVPLVELRTTNDIAYVTDSGGVVAFLEPGLMERKVFFTVSSPGYEYPADGFGMRGTSFLTTPGKSVTLRLKRLNIAERLYRQTGEGIYRDSILAGIAPPLRNPLLNGDVVGQDSVLAIPYRGAIHWFWGDTSRPDYPLGNFHTTGAVSSLNADPGRGIDFSYLTGPDGFARAMIPIDAPGPVWISGLGTVDGGAHMIGYYSRVDQKMSALERGLVLYDDVGKVFDRVARFDVGKPMPLDGHPFEAESGGVDYLVGTSSGAAPLPWVRVPAALAAVTDLRRYEAFTCLKPGTGPPELERDAAGHLVYGWKGGAHCLTFDDQKRLIASGKLRPEEAPFQLRDIETGRPIRPHSGSVYWNAYLRRWIMVFGESGGGVSNVGEIWFAEADSAVGPWVYARKVATHPKMDFYNPTQQPFLDREGGRLIYFEGTYVNTFSDNPVTTPRYNYNNLMYRIALDDLRLSLPLPVYELTNGGYRMADHLDQPLRNDAMRRAAFFAVPPEHKHAGLMAVYRTRDGFQAERPRLSIGPLFYALSPDKADAADTEPLKDASGRIICRVWHNPLSVLMADFGFAPTLEGK